MSQAFKELVELYGEDPDFDSIEGLRVVKPGSWEQDGKYQLSETVVRYKGELFSITESRTGSPFTDWWYGETWIAPVEEREETVVIKTYVGIGAGLAVERD